MSRQVSQPVIVCLAGGLGNQMFQYALGRRLATDWHAELMLDLSAYRRDTARRYRLDALRVQARIHPAPSGVDRALAWLLRRPLLGPVRRLFPAIDSPVYTQQKFCYDPDVLLVGPGTYLHGYWQSERYFSHVREALRAELAPRLPLRPHVADAARRIEQACALSVHVRRGDYVHEPTVARVHGTCSLEYYTRAVDHVRERAAVSAVYLFSDDPRWAIENVKTALPTILVGADGELEDFEEMYLMSRCRHHVIANSSFSWWGAWLNPRSDKIVVAPARWFNDFPADTRDLLPDGWVRI
jgi:hypothetical protein